jgi:hypothetical protein
MAQPSVDHIPAGGFVLIGGGSKMIRWKAKANDRMPDWTAAWHLWTVIIPRRTITGRLVCGTVWRRYNGRR